MGESASRAMTTGIWCPTLTPVDERGDACRDLLAAHCRWVLAEGCAGIALFGTTGEANSFTIDERRAVLDALLADGIGPDQLIVGSGCCAVGDSVALARHALGAGCARVLMLPPFYYKSVSEQGIIDAYARTIETIADPRLRLYLYRIPQLSGVDITPAIVEALAARYPTCIAGIKDSAGDPASLLALCRWFGASMDVLAGSERHLLAALEAGAAGCITASANVVPGLLRDLYERRDAELAHALASRRDAIESLPAIAALKELTSRRTRDARWRNVRPPLEPLTQAQLLRLPQEAG